MVASNFGEMVAANLRARYGEQMRADEAAVFCRELWARVARRVAAMPEDGRTPVERFDAAVTAELTQ